MNLGWPHEYSPAVSCFAVLRRQYDATNSCGKCADEHDAWYIRGHDSQYSGAHLSTVTDYSLFSPLKCPCVQRQTRSPCVQGTDRTRTKIHTKETHKTCRKVRALRCSTCILSQHDTRHLKLDSDDRFCYRVRESEARVYHQSQLSARHTDRRPRTLGA